MEGTDSIVLAMARESELSRPVLLAPTPTKPLTPTANPPSQTFLASVQVVLTSPTSGAKIHYTMDGSTPTGSSPEFKSNEVLTFTETTTLKAVAIKNGEISDVGAFTYTKAEPPPADVTATPPSGTTFATTQLVTLSTATSGALIHYTTDGTTPTCLLSNLQRAVHAERVDRGSGRGHQEPEQQRGLAVHLHEGR